MIVKPRPLVSFTVFGTPQTRGSKRPIARNIRDKRTGKLRVIAQAVDSNPRSKDWMAAVSEQAARAMIVADLECEIERPIFLAMTFVLIRPASHFTKSGELRISAPVYPRGRKDADKLGRPTQDAMQGQIFGNDNQVASCCSDKRFGRSEGASIRVFIGPKDQREARLWLSEQRSGVA